VRGEMKYRIYIDETGNPDLKSSDNPLHRYLGLTGIILDLDESKFVLTKKLDEIKENYFSIEYDEPIILHRKEIINKKPPFAVLRDPAIEKGFNFDLLRILETVNFKVITVVIDKLEHRHKYSSWKYDPYHYCLAVLIERFILFLESINCKGDAMAESRGGKEDRRLKKSFQRLYVDGTMFIDQSRFKSSLTSSELKVKPKSSNVAALQIADLIAHPSRLDVLENLGGVPYNKNIFGQNIVDLLIREKYDRSRTGKIDGYGRKLLP
jgi:hypothetical protein